MHDLIKNRPLARGFIENGNFHILIQWPFTEEFTTFQTLEKSLCDFMRADSFYLRTFLDLLLGRYIKAKEYKNDYDFIAAVLMQTAMEHGLIGKNNYLTVYFLSFIQLLLEGMPILAFWWTRIRSKSHVICTDWKQRKAVCRPILQNSILC